MINTDQLWEKILSFELPEIQKVYVQVQRFLSVSFSSCVLICLSYCSLLTRQMQLLTAAVLLSLNGTFKNQGY